MKTVKAFFCGGLALLLVCGLAACHREEEPSAPEAAESSQVSSLPESQPEQESSLFVPAEDLIPPQSGVEESDFERAFSQNPIDRQYDADYAVASSFSMMLQACDTAARQWKNMVNIAYEAALRAASSAETVTLREEQDKWLETLDNRISILREDNGDDNEGKLNSAREIVLLYRDRAKELCRVKFEADGSLPDFPDPESAFGEAAG